MSRTKNFEKDEDEIKEADEKDEINTPVLPKLRGVGLNTQKQSVVNTKLDEKLEIS